MTAPVTISLEVNGERVAAQVLPRVNLADFLRDHLHLTGTHVGCEHGVCGACTIRVNGEIVRACLMLAVQAHGRLVETIEGLSDSGEIIDLQAAFREHNALQCGYCTPGFVVSMFAQHYCGNHDVHALGGNLCRCTGYRPNRDALATLGPAPEGFFLDRLSQPVSAPRPFDYQTPRGRFSRPGNLESCLELASSDPKARFLAGNTDLGALTNLRDQRYQHLISLESVAELEAIVGTGPGDRNSPPPSGPTVGGSCHGWTSSACTAGPS